MSDFIDKRDEYQKARLDRDEAKNLLFFTGEKLKRLNKKKELLDRFFQGGNREHEAEKQKLTGEIEETKSSLLSLKKSYADITSHLDSRITEFIPFSDPKKMVSELTDDTPFLLFPVRIETRFKKITEGSRVKDQLWVRIYPDDCLVDSFEAAISEGEAESAETFWIDFWKAGGIETQERGAWKGFVNSHGSGRASWIIEHIKPLNPESKPVKTNKNDIILIISTYVPLTEAKKNSVFKFWKNYWLADGNREKQEEAFDILVSELGEEFANKIVTDYIPANLEDVPAPPFKKSDVSLSIELIIFQNPEELDIKQEAWTQAAKANLLPDRFVFMAFSEDVLVKEQLGNLIPTPLVMGPDPSLPKEEQIHKEDDEIIINQDLNWMLNFEDAVLKGMGFKIDLTSLEARKGFDRILVLGVRLASDKNESQILLQTLFTNHYKSRKGFGLLSQGTPTNNTEDSESGYTYFDDADESFDRFFTDKFSFSESEKWTDKNDGQWLAECLGIDNSVIENVPNSTGSDQIQARAMNIALWPATLGYFLESMLDPVINEGNINSIRWFFNHFISGRGMVPAVRIGRQPYGILPATVFSKMQFGKKPLYLPLIERVAVEGMPFDWSTEIGTTDIHVTMSSNPTAFLTFLHLVLSKIQGDWVNLLNKASYIGKNGDAHKILLDVLGLHSGSVEFYSRYAENFDQLYNRLKLETGMGEWAEMVQSIYISTGIALLQKFGYHGKITPEILNKFFLKDAKELNRPLIDDVPLTEIKPIRDYTPAPDQKNYIKWLYDAAGDSLEKVRRQQGFIDNKPPQALLYVLLRHAIQLGYWDTSLRFHYEKKIMGPEQIRLARKEASFIHIKENIEKSESKWAYLYKTEPSITGSNTKTIAEYIPTVLHVRKESRYLYEQLKALDNLKDASTAALERVLCEHIDCCSYRLDAWKQGLINYRLTSMRYKKEGDSVKVNKGIFLGAFGWLEDIRPEFKILSPVKPFSDPELNAKFHKPEDAPLVRDNKNGGYIFTPSLNQAVTAAVLRNGYVSNALPEMPGVFGINLSSERVRMAIGILEGIRNGQNLAALLGYQFERYLHDSFKTAEVDQFIYELRTVFPLYSGRFNTTKTDEDVPIEAVEARNVINGLDFINHIKESGIKTYPFGKTLPSASDDQIKAINGATDHILNIHDALADLAMAESVHQVVQGNYDRTAATLEAYSKANFPPQPEVVQTPRSGTTLTHRVALHLELASELNPHDSPYPEILMTPRSKTARAINKWLAGVLPHPDNVVCSVKYIKSDTDEETESVVSQKDLKLQPIDLILLLDTEGNQAETSLDDLIINYAMNLDPSPRIDKNITISYTQRIENKITFFELTPLVKNLRSIILKSRPLKPTDMALADESKTTQDSTIYLDHQVLSDVCQNLKDFNNNHMLPFCNGLESDLGEDPLANKNLIINNIDIYIDDFISVMKNVSLYKLSQTGYGFTYKWKSGIMLKVFEKINELTSRWQDRIEKCNTVLAEYAALPSGTEDNDKFILLQQAENLISTVPTLPTPATPVAFETIINNKKTKIINKMTQFNSIVDTYEPGLAVLMSGINALLPVSDIDSTGLDISDQEKSIVIFAEDLYRQAKKLSNDCDKRIVDIETGITEALVLQGLERVKKITSLMRVFFGDDFPVQVEFDLDLDKGDELKKTYDSLIQLTNYQINTKNCDFPVDEWLYGVARVREKIKNWEKALILINGFGKTEPELHPLQLPYMENDHWLALEYPPDYNSNGEKLMYTAHFPAGFNKAKRQSGFLIDEWTEVIPTKTETAAVTFHYDQPNSEPPQTMLLVTPPAITGRWKWEDLVNTLDETLTATKQRALEPSHIDTTFYARFLPAVITAATVYPITISCNVMLAQNISTYLGGGSDE